MSKEQDMMKIDGMIKAMCLATGKTVSQVTAEIKAKLERRKLEMDESTEAPVSELTKDPQG